MSKNAEKLKNLKHRCYLIANTINGKVYIGTTHKNIDVRFKEHIKVSNYTDNNKKQAIHKAISKYGISNFEIKLLSEYEDAVSAYAAEIEYIKKYKSCDNQYGYNQSTGGDCGPLNFRFERQIIIDILTDFCNGMLLKQISIKYNIPYYSVFDITRLKCSLAHNLPEDLLDKLKLTKQQSNKRKKIGEKEIISIITDFVAGGTMQQIAERHQLSLNNVWNILHRNTWKNIQVCDDLHTELRKRLNKRHQKC